MKTTPKPSATKKSKGELVGPPPPELTADDVAAVAETAVLEGVVTVGLAIFALGRGCGTICRDWTWLVGAKFSVFVEFVEGIKSRLVTRRLKSCDLEQMLYEGLSCYLGVRDYHALHYYTCQTERNKRNEGGRMFGMWRGAEVVTKTSQPRFRRGCSGASFIRAGAGSKERARHDVDKSKRAKEQNDIE